MADFGQVLVVAAGQVPQAGRPRARVQVNKRRVHSLSMPRGFPTGDDLRARMALRRLAAVLHGRVEQSSRWPDHACRLDGHGRRIAEEMRKRTVLSSEF